jgi:hypothetical protein
MTVAGLHLPQPPYSITVLGASITGKRGTLTVCLPAGPLIQRAFSVLGYGKWRIFAADTDALSVQEVLIAEGQIVQREVVRGLRPAGTRTAWDQPTPYTEQHRPDQEEHSDDPIRPQHLHP